MPRFNFVHMKRTRIPRHWHALKPVNQIPDDQRCFDLESIQVDHVYGKSDKVVLPEFELEVVHEFLESQTGQDDDKSEDQDHSRSPSVFSKADSQGRVAQGAGLPAQVDAATLGSNLVKSVRGTQQGTSSSSTDLGILHVRFHPLSPNIKSSLDSTRSDNFARVAFIHYSTTTAWRNMYMPAVLGLWIQWTVSSIIRTFLRTCCLLYAPVPYLHEDSYCSAFVSGNVH